MADDDDDEDDDELSRLAQDRQRWRDLLPP